MKVVIVGAGFGGLKLARKLNNKKGIEVVLIDRFNYHQFQPLFYQVATSGLDASNISFPLRKVFQKSKNVRIRLDTLQQIVPAENKIITNTGDISYEVLVLAMGADTNFFNNQNISENSFPMKSTVEALQIRHRLIQTLEDALTITDKDILQRMMNIVVVGGGPTGVELSGALAEMKKYVLPKDYPELDFSKMNIYLVEGTGKTLGTMSEKSSNRSKQYLEKLGVQVLLHQLVKDYDGQNVVLQDGNTLQAATLIWAAGIKGNIPGGIDKSLIARGNRLVVDRMCRLTAYNNIYSIGDLAYMTTPKYPNGHPQVAPVAIQQAIFLAKNLTRGVALHFSGFEYKDKGSMATVGRNLAVVDVPRPPIHFGGFIAWMIWMGLHLMLILGVKNRFFVFSNWLYNYITYDQNLRLIFTEFYRPKKK
ncbi:MAG: NAD(P)/FAD-dependent oxidoreductase [Bacteroidetes bacterium]|nr:NAD(P)/FAD-dependent oxidoreductase [Bacteroidota bacterium]MBS1931768.1 NAD(P)/FAD-dependent oxidoreductase [Bacteroidota bacterium]